MPNLKGILQIVLRRINKDCFDPGWLILLLGSLSIANVRVTHHRWLVSE
jgi:hypothetical protein